jgi:hypothetical protein
LHLDLAAGELSAPPSVSTILSLNGRQVVMSMQSGLGLRESGLCSVIAIAPTTSSSADPHHRSS